jgi:hypothetical protein
MRILHPSYQSQEDNGQPPRDREVDPLVKAMVQANAVRQTDDAAEDSTEHAQLDQVGTDGSRQAPGTPRAQGREWSVKDVGGDGLCDRVTEDDIWWKED